MTDGGPLLRRAGWIMLAALFLFAGLAAAERMGALQPIRSQLARGPAGEALMGWLGGDTTAIADRAYARCARKEGAAKSACYQAVLLPLVNGTGARTAMGTLHRLGDRDRDVRFNGHEYAHMIGIAAYRAHPEVTATFATCTEIFQSGCYHGVIQTYLRSLPHVGHDEINAVCSPYTAPDADRWLRFQCVHGMGHGLTMFYDHDLRASLAGCDALDEEWDRKSCYGGAFMENIVHATNPHDDHDPLSVGSGSMARMPMGKDGSAGASTFRAVDPSDPQYPCSILGARYQDDCYQTQPAVMLTINSGDYAKTFTWCDAVPPDLRRRCYQGTGTTISGETLMNHAESARLCSLGTPAYQPWCYVGVVKNYVDVTANPADGFSFCRDVAPGAGRVACYNAVGEEIAVLRAATPAREQLCALAPGDGLDACRYGARLSTTTPRGLEQ